MLEVSTASRVAAHLADPYFSTDSQMNVYAVCSEREADRSRSRYHGCFLMLEVFCSRAIELPSRKLLAGTKNTRRQRILTEEEEYLVR